MCRLKVRIRQGRNCLSKWIHKSLSPIAASRIAANFDADAWSEVADLDGVRHLVYGMPYAEWKQKHQQGPHIVFDPKTVHKNAAASSSANTSNAAPVPSPSPCAGHCDPEDPVLWILLS